MNILFVYTSEIIPENGGVQRVTSVLSEYFVKQRHKVIYLSTNVIVRSNKKKEIQFFLPNQFFLYCDENRFFYQELIIKNKIDIIINQAALGGTLVRFCDFSKSISKAKIISVIHNSLLGNITNFTSSHEIQLKRIYAPYIKNILNTSIAKKIIKSLYILKYKKAYTKAYNKSDKIVLLSANYLDELKIFIPNCDLSKVTYIYNPLTINTIKKQNSKKLNELLYVGRINTSQKKVDILLYIWNKVFNKFPDWKLLIIGEGSEKSELERKANKIGLKRVEFFGQQNPIAFYERAKILCMTSAYEGFPLVLSEAQSFGVVPIAFNSFSAVSDIISNDENGILIEPFNIDIYSTRLSKLMSNNEVLDKLSNNCKKSVKRFSSEAIGEQWLDLFKTLVK